MEYSHQGYTECWAIHFWEVVNILTSEWWWLFTIHNYILLCTRQSWLAQWRNMPDQSLKKQVWVFMCSHINWSLLKSLCKINLSLVCCCSVAKTFPSLCDFTDCSVPGFPVLHIPQSLLELISIEAVMPPNHLILCHSLCLLPSIFSSIRVFSMSRLFASGAQSIGASATVLPMNILKSWFPLGLMVWSPYSPRDSKESSPTPQLKSINSSVLSFLYGPNLTSVHDFWKNHSFDYMDLCWQSDVSDF